MGREWYESIHADYRLLDKFAGMAMQSIVSSSFWANVEDSSQLKCDEVAEMAYDVACAMMNERYLRLKSLDDLFEETCSLAQEQVSQQIGKTK